MSLFEIDGTISRQQKISSTRWLQFATTSLIQICSNELTGMNCFSIYESITDLSFSFVQACLERFRSYSCTHKRPTCELEVFSSDSEVRAS